MNKLIAVLELIQILTLIISVPTFVISFIVSGICIIAGLDGTLAYDITSTICYYIIAIVCPAWCVLWVWIGMFILFPIKTK